MGIKAEDLVLRYYQRLGFRLIKQRFRTPFAEIDLFLEHPEKKFYLVVEVKRAPFGDFLEYKVSSRQKQRIQNSITWLMEQYGVIRAHLVLVLENKEMKILSDFFG